MIAVRSSSAPNILTKFLTYLPLSSVTPRIFVLGCWDLICMAQIVPVGRMLKIKVLVCLLFNWTLLIAKGPLLLAAPIMIVKGIKKYIGDPMRTHIAITLVIGLLAVLPVSSQQPQTTNPAAQAPADWPNRPPIQHNLTLTRVKTRQLSSSGSITIPGLP